jgi:hypothetical protein
MSTIRTPLSVTPIDSLVTPPSTFSTRFYTLPFTTPADDGRNQTSTVKSRGVNIGKAGEVRKVPWEKRVPMKGRWRGSAAGSGKRLLPKVKEYVVERSEMS